MKLEIREAREEDIAAIKDRLRQADKLEISAEINPFHDGSPEAALRESFERSTVRFCAVIDGTPEALFGAVEQPRLPGAANIWFLGTDRMMLVKKSFVKKSREVIANLLRSYPVLWNIVDERYASSIAWLKSCGAQFHSEPIRMRGANFYGFTIRRA